MMNPRIFKKLTKISAGLCQQLGLTDSLTKVVVGGFDNESLDSSNRFVDKKYCDNYGYFDMLDGTVGFGATVGYYEPEWDDNDALSILYDWYTDVHCDWSVYPEYKTSLKQKEMTPIHAIRFAKNRIEEA